MNFSNFLNPKIIVSLVNSLIIMKCLDLFFFWNFHKILNFGEFLKFCESFDLCEIFNFVINCTSFFLPNWNNFSNPSKWLIFQYFHGKNFTTAIFLKSNPTLVILVYPFWPGNRKLVYFRSNSLRIFTLTISFAIQSRQMWYDDEISLFNTYIAASPV